MVSDYFYMPPPKKNEKPPTEEERIKYTQERIKTVRDFLQKVVFGQTFIPDITAGDHDQFFDLFDAKKPLHANWTVAVVPSHVVINRNWWQSNVDEFCSERRAKIPDSDFFYIMMLMCRERKIKATPASGTMYLSLNKPNWLFEVPND